MKKHRKLFPALAETNQSVDCPYFCDPKCPYNCYPDSDYYNLPPQPPLSSSSLVPPPEHRISPFLIILVSVLASFFLLVCYYIITAKSCPNWLIRRRSSRQAEGEADDNTEGEGGENQVEHPVWFITTAGLQQSIINSITVCKYKKGDGLIDSRECSVCLSEFEQDETVRLLPKCNHAFHIGCIDTWLRSHTNCPLCRAHILNNDQNSENSSTDNSDTQVEMNSENMMNDSELLASQAGELEDGTSSKEEDVNIMEIIRDDEEPIIRRRCLSMDFINPVEVEESSVMKKGEKMGITRHLHKTPVAMKRSFSCGGRFFSSRQNRNLVKILIITKN